MMQVLKSTVDYGRGMSDARCSLCMYFMSRLCSRVAGQIDPNAWCRLFESK